MLLRGRVGANHSSASSQQRQPSVVYGPALRRTPGPFSHLRHSSPRFHASSRSPSTTVVAFSAQGRPSGWLKSFRPPRRFYSDQATPPLSDTPRVTNSLDELLAFVAEHKERVQQSHQQHQRQTGPAAVAAEKATGQQATAELIDDILLNLDKNTTNTGQTGHVTTESAAETLPAQRTATHFLSLVAQIPKFCWNPFKKRIAEFKSKKKPKKITLDKLKKDLEVILEKMTPAEVRKELIESFIENNNFEQLEVEDIEKAHKRKREQSKIPTGQSTITEISPEGRALHAVGRLGAEVTEESQLVSRERRKHSDRMLSHMKQYDKDWDSGPQVDTSIPYTPPEVTCHPWKVLIIGLEEEDTPEAITEGLTSMHEMNLLPKRIVPTSIEKWNERIGPPTADLHKTWSAFLSLESREDMESLLDDGIRPFGIHVNSQRCSILPIEERKTLIVRGLPLDTELDIRSTFKKFGVDVASIANEGLFIVRDQHDNATGTVRIEFKTHADAFKAKALLNVPEAEARFIKIQLKLYRFSVGWGRKNFMQELIEAKKELERERDRLVEELTDKTDKLNTFLEQKQKPTDEVEYAHELKLSAVQFKHTSRVLESTSYDLEQSAKILGLGEKQLERLIQTLGREGYPTEVIKERLKQNKANLKRLL